jgi:hypothetical protein
VQPSGVLGQALEAHLRKSELQLDDAERVLGLGTDAGLELLQFIDVVAGLNLSSFSRSERACSS